MAEEDLQRELPSNAEEALRRPPPSPERSLEVELERASESPEAGSKFIQQALVQAKAELSANEAFAAGDGYEDVQAQARESAERASQELETLAATTEMELVQSTEEPPVEAQARAKETTIEGRADVLTDAMREFDALVQKFTANANQATPEMIKRLRALMVKTHPDRLPQDPRMAEFASMLGRLKMAFGGDAGAWKNPRGGKTLVEDAQALRSKLLPVESPSETSIEPSLAPQDMPRATDVEEAKAAPLATEAEQAFESEEEKDMHTVLEDINQRMDARIAERTRELDALYAKSERNEIDQARIDELEYANGIDRKRKDLRKAQLECMLLRKKQEEIDEKIAQTQKELLPYAGAQDQNLLAVSSEAGRALTIPGMDKREELEAILKNLLTEKEGIDTQFEAKVALITDLRDTMKKLAELLVRAQALQKTGKPEQVTAVAAATQTAVEAKTAPATGGMGGYTELAPSQKEQKPNILERVIDYAASPFEKWLDFAFDPDGSSKAAIARMTQWAKELGEAKKKQKSQNP